MSTTLPLTPQPVRGLFLTTGTRDRYAVTIGRNEWFTDRYMLARREVFRSAPKASGDAMDIANLTKAVRGVLAGLDATQYDLGYKVSDSGRRTTNSQNNVDIALLHVAPLNSYLPVNAAAWRAWERTGLAPRLSSRGELLFYAIHHKRPVLLGVVLPMRLSPRAGAVTVDLPGRVA